MSILSQKYIKENFLVEKMMDEELHIAALQWDVKVFDKAKG
ncbi:hypothetical protein BVRB_9g216110 [Beta vulgaris subsp. vulgaris]|nr:hypothetical protein BVRB_9g216110 [Beta vulgaris subsp. vulgaris]